MEETLKNSLERAHLTEHRLLIYLESLGIVGLCHTGTPVAVTESASRKIYITTSGHIIAIARHYINDPSIWN